MGNFVKNLENMYHSHPHPFFCVSQTTYHQQKGNDILTENRFIVLGLVFNVLFD